MKFRMEMKNKKVADGYGWICYFSYYGEGEIDGSSLSSSGLDIIGFYSKDVSKVIFKATERSCEAYNVDILESLETGRFELEEISENTYLFGWCEADREITDFECVIKYTELPASRNLDI